MKNAPPDEKLTLIQKLAKIRVMSDVVLKTKNGHNYKYAGIDEILANVTAGMKKYHVSLIPIIIQDSANLETVVTRNTKFDKAGAPYEAVKTEVLVSANMNFRWIDDDNPRDYIDVSWYVVGQQSDPSQAFGSGLTYCTRYFLINFFQIAQPETDVDAYRSKQKASAVAEEREIAEEIIARFDTILRQYLSDHPDSKEEIEKFIGRYAKKSNYLSIKEPALAAKLLGDFRGKYLSEEPDESEEN